MTFFNTPTNTTEIDNGPEQPKASKGKRFCLLPSMVTKLCYHKQLRHFNNKQDIFDIARR
jgi:hypothetical protein